MVGPGGKRWRRRRRRHSGPFGSAQSQTPARTHRLRAWLTIEEVERGLAGVKAEKEILFTPPVAILIRYVHPRMAAQRSRFTVHGRKKDSLSELVPSDILRLYKIDPRCRDCLKRDLRMLGVDRATAFQDLEGLARELTARYAPGLLE